MSTYTPLPAWPVVAYAAAVLVAGFVVGPLLGRWLFARTMRAVDDNLAEVGDE